MFKSALSFLPPQQVWPSVCLPSGQHPLNARWNKRSAWSEGVAKNAKRQGVEYLAHVHCPQAPAALGRPGYSQNGYVRVSTSNRRGRAHSVVVADHTSSQERVESAMSMFNMKRTLPVLCLTTGVGLLQAAPASAQVTLQFNAVIPPALPGS